MSERIQQYVAVIVGASIASAVTVYVSAGFGIHEDVVAAGFFSMLVVLAHLLRYEGGSRAGAAGTIAFLPVLACVFVAPAASTPLAVGAAVLLAELAGRRPPIRVVFNVAQMVFACCATILTVRLFPALVQDGGPTLEGALGLICGAVAFHAVNTCTVARAISIDTNQRFGDVWLRGAVRTLPYDIFALPVVYLLSWGYVEHGGGLVLLFVLPIFGLRQLYKQNWELIRASEELLQVMVKQVEAQHPYTSGHSQRVSLYALKIGRSLKLKSADLEQLRVAALLHDVGKIFEEFAAVLRKEGRLTDAERRLMQTHPIRSAELAAHVSKLKPVIPAVRSHHERWDGHGYPDRLSGEGIPLHARIIAIADTVDAMTSSRPYRAALPIETVRREIELGTGRQFDPAICRVLLMPDAWESFEQCVATSNPESVAASAPVHVPPPSPALRPTGYATALTHASPVRG